MGRRTRGTEEEGEFCPKQNVNEEEKLLRHFNVDRDTPSGHDAKLSLVGFVIHCPAVWFMRTLASGDCLQAGLVYRPVSFSGLVKEVPLGNRGPGF